MIIPNSPSTLIGSGIIFPLNINDQGKPNLDTGWPLLKSSINNILAFIIGTRYFLGEFGANPEDLLEEPNDEISQVVLEHRLNSQLPYWDQRIVVNFIQVDRPSDTEVNLIISIGLKDTDLSEIFVVPVTINTVQ